MKKITTIENEKNFKMMEENINYIMNLEELNEEVFNELQRIEEKGFYCPVTEEVFKDVPFEERWYIKYYPTYHMSVLLVKYYLDGHSEVEEQLLKTLDACLSKEYRGHGYESDTICLNYLTELFRAGLKTVMNKFDLFRCGFENITYDYRKRLAYGCTKSGFSDIKESIICLLKEIDKDMLFVYGTLMRGECNNFYLNKSLCLGECEIDGYSLLQLNGYPGMIKGTGKVVGELYCINEDIKKKIDLLEGSQYSYSSGIVSVNDTCVYAHFYEFLPIKHKKYSRALCKDYKWVNLNNYVWYACYGSNLLDSRFDEYIQRTSSKEKPIVSRAIILPYELYFAKNSSRWENKGVAFIDVNKPGCIYGWRYLITKEQYQEIKDMEGNWYRQEIHVGYDDKGVEIVTFTSPKRFDDVKPGERYLDIIREGLKEKYELNDTLIDTYLNKAIK